MSLSPCRKLITAILCGGLLLTGSAEMSARNPEITGYTDVSAALEYCRDATLDRLEGLWEFPEDETKVLIKKSDIRYEYDIIVVSTPDCRLIPGEKVGTLAGSPDPDKFRLSLHCSRKYGLLTDTRSCLAEFRKNDGALVITPGKLSVSLRGVSWLLPRFWRMLRLSYKNPLDKLPAGLIRLYPPNEENGVRPLNPRYL